jgi:hypothetical protein
MRWHDLAVGAVANGRFLNLSPRGPEQRVIGSIVKEQLAIWQGEVFRVDR